MIEGEILTIVRRSLGSDLLGAYRHGSAVLGGLRPHSDIDVLVVAGRTTTERERRSIVDGMLQISGRRAYRRPGRPIELTIVVQDEVRPWRYPPRCEFLYGEWLRDDYEHGLTPAPEPMPDLAVLLSMVLQGDSVIVGPPPAQLLDPVPRTDLVAALAAGIPCLMSDLEGDTRNVMLTFARIWTTLATGEIRSKDAAAQWAIGQLPAEHRAVLQHARAIYLGQRDEVWSRELQLRVWPHMDYVHQRIVRLLPGPELSR